MGSEASSQAPHASNDPDAPSESATAYIVKRLCADRGFTPGTVPEAKLLADACDIVLTRSDGISFQLVCIVDRETDPTREFEPPLAAVVETGKACLGYTGKVQGTKMPVAIQIWEIARNAATPGDLERLLKLTRKMPGRDKVSVTGWHIDVAGARVWSSARLGGLFAGRRYLERLLREPRKADADIFQPEAVVREDVGRPWVTYVMLALMALVFAGELGFGIGPWSGPLRPDILTLLASGGLTRQLVQEGEWYRLLTAAFLHGDVFHLALNGVALWIAGFVLEHLFGRAWLLALFVIGALGGSALSLALNPPNVVSVGASGAIMGLLAAAFASSFRLPRGGDRMGIQMQLMQILIPSLIPLAAHRTGGRIDFAAHVGGALVGTAMGIFLFKTWPRTEPLPKFRKAAAAVAVAGAVTLAVGFVALKNGRAEYVQAAHHQSLKSLLIPESELGDKSVGDLIPQAEGLVKRYPRDPRARLFLAFHVANAGDFGSAEQHLRAGLAETEILEAYFDNRKLEVELRVTLARLLVQRGELEQARRVVAPVCSAGEGGAMPESLRPLNLCGEIPP